MEKITDNYIHIVGKLPDNFVKKIEWLDPKYDWYFVQYSPRDYPVGTVFTFNGNEAILVEVQLQFPIKKDIPIPKGWKTICRFEFKTPYEGIETTNWFNNSGEQWLATT